MTDAPDKLPALEAVAWTNSMACQPYRYFTTDPAADNVDPSKLTPLTDLNRANEIIAEKEAEIARLREALSQADDRLTECHGYIYQNWARPSSGALQDVIYETRAALKEE